MKQFSFHGLILFFVLLYTHGLWVRIGVPKLVVEGSLWALPLAILLRQRGILHRPPPGFLFVWFYLGWSLSACIYNDEGVLRGLLYPRYLIASYLVFWAVWNSRFTHRQLLRINTVIFALFFVQVAAAVFYWLVLGQKNEFVVGLMTYGGGGPAAVFSIFAFSCLLAFFLYYGRPILLVAGLSFFLVSHASGKLAVYYFIPLMVVLGVVRYAIVEGVPSAIRRSGTIALIAACALPFLVVLLSHTPRAENLQNEAGLYNKIATFFNYTRRTALDDRWYTTTRLSTSKRVIEETFRREPSVFLFGQGPHVFGFMSGQADEGAYDKYGIIYGTVGWSADALAVGWPAMFAHVGFYSYLLYVLLRHRGREALDRYWKAILLMVELGFFVFLLNHFLYSAVFTVGGWISSVYLYFLAVMLVPRYREMMVAGRGARGAQLPASSSSSPFGTLRGGQ